MTAIEGKITMTTCEGRPCWVKGRRAIFHRWTDSARPVKPVSYDQDTDERLQKWSVHGLAEYEDGRMEREWPNNIRFADSWERFNGLAWEQMEARRDALPFTFLEEPDTSRPPSRKSVLYLRPRGRRRNGGLRGRDILVQSVPCVGLLLQRVHRIQQVDTKGGHGMKTPVRIFLKNGVQLPDVVCEEFEVTHNVNTGEIVGYKFTDADAPYPLRIDPREIVAIFEMPAKVRNPEPRERCNYCRGTAAW